MTGTTTGTATADSAGAAITDRAVNATGMLVLRGLALRASGFLVTLALARLLAPRAYGELALALSLQTLITFIADGGLGSALIRAPKRPEVLELRTLVGLQLGITLTCWAGTLVALGLTGRREIGLVVVVCAALPISVFRAPAAIVLERELRFRPLATAEVAEVVIAGVWSLAAVLLGAGVWGVASSAVVRAAAGVFILRRLTGAGEDRGWVWPRLSARVTRRLLSFGAKFQGVAIANLVRDQGLVLGIAAVGDFRILGLWSLANRLMHLPYLVFDAMWRVSFPAMARLREAGAELSPFVQKTLRQSTVATSAVLLTVASAAPAALPTLFGSQWTSAGHVLPAAAAGLLIGGPISVSTVGLLYACDEVGAVLVGAIGQTVAWIVVALTLLPSLGVTAVGLGWFAGSVVEAAFLLRASRRHVALRLFDGFGRTCLITVVAWAASVAAGHWLGLGLLSATVRGVAALGIWLLLMWRSDPLVLRDAWQLLTRLRVGSRTADLAPGLA